MAIDASYVDTFIILSEYTLCDFLYGVLKLELDRRTEEISSIWVPALFDELTNQELSFENHLIHSAAESLGWKMQV